MRHIAWVAVLAIGLATPGGSVFGDDSRTLTGEYIVIDGEESGDLEAVFTPSGSGGWEVVFEFSFQGQPYTFSGAAEGSLSEGPLAGRVENGSGTRTFTFQGEFDGGMFWGTHAEIEADGREEPTGTMTLAE